MQTTCLLSFQDYLDYSFLGNKINSETIVLSKKKPVTPLSSFDLLRVFCICTFFTVKVQETATVHTVHTVLSDGT
jgi:hypothetical protein